MAERAWTLGTPSGYEKAVRMAGNGKAAGGYAFRTRREAEDFARTHTAAMRLAPYEILLPAPFDECTAVYDDFRVLLSGADFINPDTGERA